MQLDEYNHRGHREHREIINSIISTPLNDLMINTRYSSFLDCDAGSKI